MIASYVIMLARQKFHDLGAVRWIDTEVLGFLNTARSQILRVRPELALTTDGIGNDTYTTFTALTAPGETVGLGDEWALPLAYMIAVYALEMDDPDLANSVAVKDFRQKTEEMVRET